MPACRDGLPVSPLTPATVSFTVLVSSELGPTISSKSPGSTTVHVSVENRERLRSYGEGDGLLFSGLEGYALEAFQLHDRLRDRGDLLMDVELRHFIALARSGVGYINGTFARPSATICFGSTHMLSNLKVV